MDKKGFVLLIGLLITRSTTQEIDQGYNSYRKNVEQSLFKWQASRFLLDPKHKRIHPPQWRLSQISYSKTRTSLTKTKVRPKMPVNSMLRREIIVCVI